jgi:hypothetical protein
MTNTHYTVGIRRRRRLTNRQLKKRCLGPWRAIGIDLAFDLIEPIDASDYTAIGSNTDYTAHDHLIDWLVDLTERHGSHVTFGVSNLEPVVQTHELVWLGRGYGLPMIGRLLDCLQTLTDHPKVGEVRWRFVDLSIDDEEDCFMTPQQTLRAGMLDKAFWLKRAECWFAI